MGRGPPELGCPESQEFADDKQERHHPNAKRSSTECTGTMLMHPCLRLRYARALLTNSQDLCPRRIVLVANCAILPMVKIVRVGLKSAYPQKFPFFLVSDGGTSEFRVVGFAQKARSQLGVEEASFLLFSSLSSSFSFFVPLDAF